MNELRHRWGVLIKGQPSDIKRLGSAFAPPFDPHVSETKFGPAVWAEELQSAPGSTEAWERYKALLRIMNSAMLHTEPGSGTVDAEALVCLDGEGIERKHSFAVPHDLIVQVTISGPTATAYDAEGNPVEQEQNEPKRSRQQQWIAAAARSGDLADLLVYALKHDSWFEIYKAVEILERLCGGKRHLLASGWGDSRKIRLLKRTANVYHRHALRKFEPPRTPMPLPEAQGLLTDLIRQAFDEEQANSGGGGPSRVPGNEY